MSKKSVEDRFWAKVDRSGPHDDCWMWMACIVGGYGQFAVAHGKRVRPHRFAWESAHGPIPTGMIIDHLCRNRACVNPLHMRLCTHAENLTAPGAMTSNRRWIDYSHCRHGHLLTAENTFRTRRGFRQCRACMRRWSEETRLRQRMAA
jgi:hypothetical protein